MVQKAEENFAEIIRQNNLTVFITVVHTYSHAKTFGDAQIDNSYSLN